jgi:hypothetical protein
MAQAKAAAATKIMQGPPKPVRRTRSADKVRLSVDLEREVHRKLVLWATDAADRLQADVWRNRVPVAEVARALFALMLRESSLADQVMSELEERAEEEADASRRRGKVDDE